MASEAGDEEPSSSSEESSSSSSDSEEDESEFYGPPAVTTATTAPQGKGLVVAQRKETQQPIAAKAVCERCGTIGIRHAFYSKTKRFCSLACSRGLPKSSGGKTSSSQMKTTKRPVVQHSPKSKAGQQVRKCKIDLTGTFLWKPYLDMQDYEAAAVSCFKHVAMADSWDNIVVGMKLEVENKDCDKFGPLFPHFYWIATVIKIAGYMTKLRYEGFGTDCNKDFWINLCTEAVYPVGWCASQGKPLIPPKTIEHKYTDWKEFLVKRLTGARTLPSNFHLKVQEGLKSRFKPGIKLEVVDKNRISCVRVARIQDIVGGRLHITYEAAEEGDEGFWCHERSPLIHPIGWAQIVGHDLRASLDYARKSLQKTLLKKFEPDDTTWDMFPPVKNPLCELKFKKGMKMEAIDPLNLSTICVATVTRVLRNNYLMIGIDGMMAANGSDWFCYHASSPHIFPVGFCELNNIDLTPPRGHIGEFKWFDYLTETKSVAAPVSLFRKELPNHGFKEDMHVEAVDLMEPRLICVGKVTRVVGRLLRVHFDGWDETYDQWCDCESPDLFPVGWCQVVGYRLEPPRTDGADMLKKKKKYQIYKGPRKKLVLSDGTEKKLPVGRPPLHPRKGGLQFKLGTNDDSYERDYDSSDGIISRRSISGSSDYTVRLTPTIPSTPLSQVQPSATAKSSSGALMSIPHSEADPEAWTVLDVAQFLRINECGAYCQMFGQQRIDGKKFLSMSKEDVMGLTGMKVGPSLKIFDLITQLLSKQTKRF